MSVLATPISSMATVQPGPVAAVKGEDPALPRLHLLETRDVLEILGAGRRPLVGGERMGSHDEDVDSSADERLEANPSIPTSMGVSPSPTSAAWIRRRGRAGILGPAMLGVATHQRAA